MAFGGGLQLNMTASKTTSARIPSPEAPRPEGIFGEGELHGRYCVLGCCRLQTSRMFNRFLFAEGNSVSSYITQPLNRRISEESRCPWLEDISGETKGARITRALKRHT